MIVPSNGSKNEPSIFGKDQASALLKAGHQVVMLVCNLYSLRHKRQWGIFRLNSEPYPVWCCSFPLGAVPPVPLSLFFCSSHILLRFAMKRILKTCGRPDVLHAHFYTMGAIARFIKQDYGIPLVVTEHFSNINQDVLPTPVRRLAEQAYRAADKIISVSSGLRRRIAQHFSQDSVVIANIVDFPPMEEHSAEEKEGFVLVSAGHLLYGKGFDLLLKAFSAAGFDASVRLKIMGAGAYEAELRKMAADLHLEARVELSGRPYKREDFFRVCRDADCFVLASRGETFGLVYVEAMAAGCPVIATDCGGPSDFVTAENGLLIPPENVEDLMEALQQMRHTARTYDRAEIARFVRARFSPEVVAAQITAVYEQAVARM